MSLVDELMKDVYTEEDKAHKERNIRREAREIKIHPDWFYKLLAEVNIMLTHKIDKDGNHTFRGIPLVRDEEVEKWKVIV